MKNSKKIALYITAGLLLVSGTFIYKNRSLIYSEVKEITKTNGQNEYKSGNNVTNTFENFLDCKVKNKSVVIFEPNPYHHECLPGYSKYFTELGYNVDTLIIKNNEDSMSLFQPEDKLRMFLYDDLKQIDASSKVIAEKFKEYDYVLIHTTDKDKKDLYKKLGVLDSGNSIFVAHDTKFAKEMGMQKFFDENRIITLGDFEDGIQVNPHYFGEIPIKSKNKKTRFFITSTTGRNYDFLIEAAKTLKEEGLDFAITVTGRNTDFTSESVPENIRDNFTFKHGLPYKEMYKEVENSDYIIINLDPDNESDNAFKNLRVSGSAQLAYGFLKPALIHKEFAGNYKMTDENSFIYEKSNFTETMRKAIKLNSEKYREKQSSLKKLANNIHDISLENLKKIMKI